MSLVLQDRLNAFLFSQTWKKPELVSHTYCGDEHKPLDKQGESTGFGGSSLVCLTDL